MRGAKACRSPVSVCGAAQAIDLTRHGQQQMARTNAGQLCIGQRRGLQPLHHLLCSRGGVVFAFVAVAGDQARERQPCGLNTRSVDAGLFSSLSVGRTGRRTSSPPQLGQMPYKRVSAHSAQKVHSKEQIRAFGAAGGRSRLQHSQLGRSWSMGITW